MQPFFKHGFPVSVLDAPSLWDALAYIVSFCPVSDLYKIYKASN